MKPVYLLALVPPLLNVVGAFFSRLDGPFVLGMPPILAWVVGGVLVTSLVMQVIYMADTRQARLQNATDMGGPSK